MAAMNELPDDLARAFAALDQRAARAASKVDAGRVAARVLQRLRSGEVPAAQRPLWQLTAVRIAAAAVLIAATAVTARRFAQQQILEVAALPLPLPSDSLSPTDLDDLLRAVDEARAVANPAFEPVAGTVDELTDAELRTLLETLKPRAD